MAPNIESLRLGARVNVLPRTGPNEKIAQLPAHSRKCEDGCCLARAIAVEVRSLKQQLAELLVESKTLRRCLEASGISLQDQISSGKVDSRTASSNDETAQNSAIGISLGISLASRQRALSSSAPPRTNSVPNHSNAFLQQELAERDRLGRPRDLYTAMRPIIEGTETGGFGQREVVRHIRDILKDSAEPPHSWQGPGTPLSSAASVGQAELVQLLLKARASPNETNDCAISMLHIAATQGSLGVCRALTSARADANAKDRSGATPLFFATKPGICKVLFEGNADLYALNVKDQSALHLAAQNGHRDVLTWLSSRVNRTFREHKDQNHHNARTYELERNLSRTSAAERCRGRRDRSSPTPKKFSSISNDEITCTKAVSAIGCFGGSDTEIDVVSPGSTLCSGVDGDSSLTRLDSETDLLSPDSTLDFCLDGDSSLAWLDCEAKVTDEADVKDEKETCTSVTNEAASNAENKAFTPKSLADDGAIPETESSIKAAEESKIEAEIDGEATASAAEVVSVQAKDESMAIIEEGVKVRVGRQETVAEAENQPRVNLESVVSCNGVRDETSANAAEEANVAAETENAAEEANVEAETEAIGKDEHVVNKAESGVTVTTSNAETKASVDPEVHAAAKATARHSAKFDAEVIAAGAYEAEEESTANVLMEPKVKREADPGTTVTAHASVEARRETDTETSGDIDAQARTRSHEGEVVMAHAAEDQINNTETEANVKDANMARLNAEENTVEYVSPTSITTKLSMEAGVETKSDAGANARNAEIKAEYKEGATTKNTCEKSNAESEDEAGVNTAAED